jgi:hypothetical protein
LLGITEYRLKVAEVISASDPNDPEFRLQLWGQKGVPPLVPSRNPTHRVDEVRVQLDSKHPEQLRDLLRMVESAKGRLPEDVRHLMTEGDGHRLLGAGGVQGLRCWFKSTAVLSFLRYSPGRRRGSDSFSPLFRGRLHIEGAPAGPIS